MSGKSVFDIGFNIDFSQLDKSNNSLEKLQKVANNFKISKVSEAFNKIKNNVADTNKQIDKQENNIYKLRMPLDKIPNIYTKITDKLNDYNQKLKKTTDSTRGILNLMRLIAITKLATPILDKATNFSDNANNNAMDADAMNSKVKNIKAIDYAFDLHGSVFNRAQAGEIQNNLSNVEKYHAFAGLGIGTQDLENYKKMDGADAYMSILNKITQRIETMGGYDDIGAKSALNGFVNELGLKWEELKGLSKNGRLEKINKEYQTRKKEDNRDYTSFEKFERIKKKFILALDDIWEGLVSKMLPAVNIVSQAFTRALRAISDKIGNSEVISKFSEYLKGAGDKVAGFINKIDIGAGFDKVTEWFAKIPNLLSAFWETLKNLVSGLATLLNKIPGALSDEALAKIKMSIDSDYTTEAMSTANKKINEKGILSNSKIENLNKYYEKGMHTQIRTELNGTLDELLSSVGVAGDSKEAASVKAKAQSALQNGLRNAKKEGRDVSLNISWDTSTRELIISGKDKKTNESLMRQTIMRLQD